MAKMEGQVCQLLDITPIAPTIRGLVRETHIERTTETLWSKPSKKSGELLCVQGAHPEY